MGCNVLLQLLLSHSQQVIVRSIPSSRRASLAVNLALCVLTTVDHGQDYILSYLCYSSPSVGLNGPPITPHAHRWALGARDSVISSVVVLLWPTFVRYRSLHTGDGPRDLLPWIGSNTAITIWPLHSSKSDWLIYPVLCGFHCNEIIKFIIEAVFEYIQFILS